MKFNLLAGMVISIPYTDNADRDAKLAAIRAAIFAEDITSDEVTVEANPPMKVGYFDSEKMDVGSDSPPTPPGTFKGQTISRRTIYIGAVRWGGLRGQSHASEKINADDFAQFQDGFAAREGDSISTANGDILATGKVGIANGIAFSIAYRADETPPPAA